MVGFFGGFSTLGGYIFSTVHPLGGAAFGGGIVLTSFLAHTITDCLPFNEETPKTIIKTTLLVIGLLTIPMAAASLVGFPLTVAGAAKHMLATIGTVMIIGGPLELYLLRYEAVPDSERPFYLRF
jgi:hypothetical protein